MCSHVFFALQKPQLLAMFDFQFVLLIYFREIAFLTRNVGVFFISVVCSNTRESVVEHQERCSMFIRNVKVDVLLAHCWSHMWTDSVIEGWIETGQNDCLKNRFILRIRRAFKWLSANSNVSVCKDEMKMMHFLVFSAHIHFPPQNCVELRYRNGKVQDIIVKWQNGPFMSWSAFTWKFTVKIFPQHQWKVTVDANSKEQPIINIIIFHLILLNISRLLV